MGRFMEYSKRSDVIFVLSELFNVALCNSGKELHMLTHSLGQAFATSTKQPAEMAN
jgi:hypothetical protein